MSTNNLEPRAKIGDVVIVRTFEDGIKQVVVLGAEWIEEKDKDAIKIYGDGFWSYDFRHHNIINPDNGEEKYDGFEDEDIIKNLTTGKEYGND